MTKQLVRHVPPEKDTQAPQPKASLTSSAWLLLKCTYPLSAAGLQTWAESSILATNTDSDSQDWQLLLFMVICCPMVLIREFLGHVLDKWPRNVHDAAVQPLYNVLGAPSYVRSTCTCNIDRMHTCMDQGLWKWWTQAPCSACTEQVPGDSRIRCLYRVQLWQCGQVWANFHISVKSSVQPFTPQTPMQQSSELMLELTCMKRGIFQFRHAAYDLFVDCLTLTLSSIWIIHRMITLYTEDVNFSVSVLLYKDLRFEDIETIHFC